MTLDQQQRIAIASDAPIIAVVAGPGSGKTRVLTERARHISNSWLWKEGGDTPRIVILTYTNAAAHEIRDRLAGAATVEFIGTLHSWCLRLLQNYGYLIGYRPGAIAILAASDRERVLLDVRDRLAVKISDTKLLQSGVTQETELIWKEYDFVLKRSGLVDYDRILKDAAILLNLGVVLEGIGTIGHLLVDEAQDSAVIDWLLYSKLPATNRFYVGDPDQAVFAFRGTYPAGFVEFTHHAVTLRLEHNYRSDKSICAAANALIVHNKIRVDKAIIPSSEYHGVVEVHGFDNAFLELEDVAARIRAERGEFHALSSVAVLCRVNSEVKRCVEYLQEAGIPIADRSQRELPSDWKRALLLLGIAINPTSDILVEQFLRMELSAVHVNRLKLSTMTSGSTLHHASGRPVCLPTDTLDSLVSYLKSNGVSDATVGLVRARAALLASESVGLNDLLTDLHAHSEAPAANSEEGKVFVSTIHGAKGKEFDVVFLPAFEQGIIPILSSIMVRDKDGVAEPEEERRLAFVAITRARHKVFISYATRRKHQWHVAENLRSQFIAEMGL